MLSIICVWIFVASAVDACTIGNAHRCLAPEFSVYAVDNLVDAIQHLDKAADVELRFSVHVQFNIGNVQTRHVNRQTHNLQLLVPARTLTIVERDFFFTQKWIRSVRVRPTELNISYHDFLGHTGLFRDALYGALKLQIGYDKYTIQKLDCERRLINYRSTDEVTPACIQWITGIGLINLLHPICVT